ncbi:hypothetical protein FF38_07143 [Lucilia cuprina]|uniref:Nucleolus and neural progenitor protein-like N-terminal domain-containing protein n=1 Tax=Lucilia cuprina TaxID=7375 RepID=A0A0L0BZM3_LUCCU|nr:hypothetical protein CVS40_12256 [Lucilia cuprina]KNC25426.1 hypothetical protein FF38_05138 [Lucilia cuprina]KNC33039.1 hypothetical protein FF38_07143 [Lucilia cuprina]
MERIWNDFNLKKPPFVTLPGKHSRFIIKLHAAIENYYSSHAQYDAEFSETAALLSRLMARRKNSFSKMKGFKDICKLNAALCRLLRIDFKRDLDSFRNTLPDVDYEEGTSIQLPTRDSYNFLLIRLIAIYELHRRIVECCESAAAYVTCQIRSNFFFEINTLLLAVLAKIHNLSIKLLNFAVSLYNNTLHYREKLPFNVKSKFLKDIQFEFPDKLEEIEIGPLETNQTSLTDKELPLKNLIQQEEKLAVVKAQKLKKTDVGQQVQRVTKLEQQKQFNIEQLSSVEEIKRFIAKEAKSRSINLSAAITTKVLSHEWAGATKLFERKVQSGEAKKAVSIFRKFLSLKIV